MHRLTLSPYLPLCFPTTAGAYVRVYTSFSPAFSVMESLPLRSRPSMVTSSVISSGVGFLTMTSSTAFFCKVRKQSVTDMNTKNTYLISKYEFDILNKKLNKVWKFDQCSQILQLKYVFKNCTLLLKRKLINLLLVMTVPYLATALDSHDPLRWTRLDVDLEGVPHPVTVVLPALLILLIGDFITITVNLTVIIISTSM